MKNYIIMNILFWELAAIFVVINAEYLSLYNNGTHENVIIPGRSKRSLYSRSPKILNALIQTESGKYIHLKWKRIKQYLANENLPVWTATEYRDKLNTNYKNELNVMDDVGDFVMYQDVEQSSAIVYFEKRRALYGVIGTNYILDDLPIKLLGKCHKVGGEYVVKRKIGFHRDDNFPDVSSDVIKSFADCNLSPNYYSEPSTSKQYSTWKFAENSQGINFKKLQENIGASCLSQDNSENYYVETLVFVTYDIVGTFAINFDEEYLMEIVTEYLIYFNAVDMTLAKLKKHGINIHINLAGIIIENEKDIFSTLLKNPNLRSFDSTSVINVDDLYLGFDDHFEYNHTPFTPDSFDLIFLMTRHLIEYNGISSGVTFSGDSIYDARRENKPYRLIPLTIMQYKNNYADYFTAAHEIGHALEIYHDPADSGDVVNNVQCYGLMQWRNSYCSKCIDWSAESVDQLKNFIRENRNRCFLLNYPRSLYPDKPRKYLTPCRQCHCYGYDSYGPIVGECVLEIPELGCMSPLPCMNSSYSQEIQEDTILPFDGTPCGKNKVCWHGECIRV